MATIEKWTPHPATGNPRWRARWRDPDGRTQSRVFARKVDAEKHLVGVEHSKLVGSYVAPAAGRTTVAEYWSVWSERQQWRASSRLSVTSLFTNHVLEGLGNRRLNSLRRGDVESWAARLPLAKSTAAQAVQWLSSMLESAVADGLLATNPARGAKRPRVEREPVVPFTGDETDALRAAAPSRFGVALTLGLGAGLRHSEATGLTLDRVDFLRRQLTVDRQLVTPLQGEPTFGPPKSARSYRTVPLADAVVEALARHVELHGTGRHDLVLCGDDGRPLRRQRFGVIWDQLRQRAGLPAARFHDTRHTYASTLLSGGVSVAAAADYLGHSPAELLNTYAHLLPADHEHARSVVQAAFARGTACHSSVTGADD